MRLSQEKVRAFKNALSVLWLRFWMLPEVSFSARDSYEPTQRMHFLLLSKAYKATKNETIDYHARILLLLGCVVS